MTGVDLKVSVKHKLQLLMIYDTARPPSEHSKDEIHLQQQRYEKNCLEMLK